MRNRIILVGCGEHYMKKYHSVLENLKSSILLLIDLEVRKEKILNFFSNKSVYPQNFVFLDESFRNSILSEQIDQFILGSITREEIDSVMLCLEPKVKKVYILWAANHRIPIFMDKPINAFSNQECMDSLLDDYSEMNKAIIDAKIDVVVSCERRMHIGYKWVIDYLRQLIDEYNVPITSIDIHFAGGNYILPHEYLIRENHPFKYGYGVLLHSGYHYVDLLATILAFNLPFLLEKRLKYSIDLMLSRPTDQQLAMSTKKNFILNNYQNKEYESDLNFYQNFGETDLMLIGQLMGNNSVLTNFSLKLFGTSISKRINLESVPLTEQIEGRLRQESVIIHLGFLCSIHICSKPLKKLDLDSYNVEDFNITVLNHPLLKNRASVITLDQEKLSKLSSSIPETLSMNVHARQTQLANFLEEKDACSTFHSHLNTVELLNSIYCKVKENLHKVA
jgi:hypothetical protein